MFKNRKKTIGVRIPAHNIAQAIVSGLNHPILTASLRSEDEILEYFTDPVDIYEDFKNQVDLVIDGGIGKNIPSTVFVLFHGNKIVNFCWTNKFILRIAL